MRNWTWLGQFVHEECQRNGSTICVANTHLNALGSPGHRLEQIKVLLNALSNNSDDIQILAGDLNTTPDSIELVYLFSQGWSDAAVKAVERVVEPTWSNQNALTKGWLRSSSARLDFVLYKLKDSQQCPYVPEKYTTVMKGATSARRVLIDAMYLDVLWTFVE